MNCTADCVKPRPFSRLEHCGVCHESFAATRPGDDHRTGRHDVTVGPERRRCRTADEMRAVGLWQDDRRIWHGRASPSGMQDRRTNPETWSSAVQGVDTATP